MRRTVTVVPLESDFAQIGKEGAVIDERFNHGGMPATDIDVENRGIRRISRWNSIPRRYGRVTIRTWSAQ